NLGLPALLRPNSTLRIPVKLDGLAAGEEARVVVAAVDVGILNLTNYKPPAPDDYYLGQRRLSAELRDLYGQLIDGMQGTRGAIKTGGHKGGAGEYRVQVQSTGVDVVGNAAPQTLRLNARQRSAVTVPLTAAAAGIANVSVRISGPANLTMERNYTLAVKPATQILARRTVRPIA